MNHAPAVPPVQIVTPGEAAPALVGRRPAWDWVGIGVLAFVVLVIGMPRRLEIYDEGIIVADAMRVLNGEIIHRDFYSVYGPAQYYVVAGLLRLFENGFLAARLYEAVLRALIIAIVFVAVRTHAPRALAVLIAALCGAWLMAVGTYLYPVFPSLLLALAGSLLVARFGAGRAGGSALFAAGLCTGAAALVRYDAGFFILAVHVMSILAFAAIWRSAPLRVRLGAVVQYGLGTALVFVPAAVAFLLVSPLAPFRADIIDNPIRYYAVMRSLPFPTLRDILHQPGLGSVFVPVLGAGLAAIELARVAAGRARACARPAAAALIVFGLASLVLFLKGLVRVSTIHMLLAIVPAAVVVGIVAARWWQLRALRAGAVIAVLLTGIPAGFEFSQFFLYRARSPAVTFAGWISEKLGLRTFGSVMPEGCASGPVLSTAILPDEYARITHYLITHARPGERILSATGRHDKVFINPVALYYTTGHLPGTHWHHYDPGIQTRADIQTEMIDDLQRSGVRWIVRDATFDQYREPNGSAVSSGVTLLDDYIGSHYHRVAGWGQVSVWLLNGEAPSPAIGDACETAP
ncbi:MAG: hypothetical protein NVSMB18_07370 [Acetobacteraceae bacterium]